MDSYGIKFKNALSKLVQAMGKTECHYVEVFEEMLKFSEHGLNKYPLAIRGLLRVVFEGIEFFINSFSMYSEDTQTEFMQALAELECLEAELDKLKKYAV